MTNFYEREQDGTIRIFGVAVHSPQTQFKIFEPENPALFIPRTWGIGWDLNVGAVAVKLGLVRLMIHCRTFKSMCLRGRLKH